MSRIPAHDQTLAGRHPDVVAFLSAHPDWAATCFADEPVYAIPAAAIESLTRSVGSRTTALFTEAAAAAERTFTRLCDGLQVVGIWNGEPVSFPLLDPPLPAPDLELMRTLGWTTAQAKVADALVKRTDEAHARLLGVAGWVATEPAFHQDVANLRAAWTTRSAGWRFPLTRFGPRYAGEAGNRAFDRRLVALLDRWGLTELTTWDLPTPQGPLVPNPLPPGSPAQPAHGVHLFVPVHYPLAGDDALLRRVREAQRAQATDLGIDPAFGGIARPGAYAQMFRVMHLERTLAGRFPGRRRGFAGHVEGAAAAVLGVSVDRVKRLRTGIAACRRGRRSSVRWLA